MYKNFSYVFGLAALILLAACDSGEKQSANKEQEIAPGSQKMMTIQREETKSIKESSSEDQAKSEIKEDDIYADINKPIESGTPSSELKDDVEADNQVNIEEVKVKEDVVVPPQHEEPVANTESAGNTSVDSVPESNVEKETQEESPKIEDAQPADAVNNEEAPKVEDIQPTDTVNNDVVNNEEAPKVEDAQPAGAVNNEEAPKVEDTQPAGAVNNEEAPKAEDTQPTGASNNAEPSVIEEVPTPTASDENTEISDKIPELSAESDASVISEEPAEVKSSDEVSLDSEPAPILEDNSPQEAVAEN